MSKTRFSPLSSLVQVIHQDGRQFVVLSYTPDSTDLFHPSLHGTIATPAKSNDSLFVEVGIVPKAEDSSNTNHWWFGVWTQQDLESFFGGNIPAQRLDVAVTRMADKFKGGELWIGNWGSGEDLKLQIDPANVSGPISIPLKEMPAEEANARGARTLFSIFAHASQNTKCSLFPLHNPLAEESKTRKERETEKRQAAIIGELQRELNTARIALNPKRLQPVAPPRPPPGASRVNPTRKKRKLETVEFED